MDVVAEYLFLELARIELRRNLIEVPGVRKPYHLPLLTSEQPRCFIVRDELAHCGPHGIVFPFFDQNGATARSYTSYWLSNQEAVTVDGESRPCAQGLQSIAGYTQEPGNTPSRQRPDSGPISSPPAHAPDIDAGLRDGDIELLRDGRRGRLDVVSDDPAADLLRPRIRAHLKARGIPLTKP
ncbi:hypothetical protein ACCS68_33925 [Rhizobium beringeri]|uniref:hypothetical protein n=1 Tax=Rhizobium TaxID=379 RepID=UPI0010305AB2|nr:hypothetical protein [Rhizobium leguminosarum]TAW53247.1 hypothetical protein ELI14_19055 [Rhizobium leguminosarum]